MHKISDIIPRSEGESKIVAISPNPESNYVCVITKIAISKYTIKMYRSQTQGTPNLETPFVSFENIGSLSALLDLVDSIIKPALPIAQPLDAARFIQNRSNKATSEN